MLFDLVAITCVAADCVMISGFPGTSATFVDKIEPVQTDTEGVPELEWMTLGDRI